MAKQSERKKKAWIKIAAPREFENKIIGETICSEINKIVGRTLRLNMSNIIGDIKRQHSIVNFVIKEVKDGIANTEVIGCDLSGSYLKRLIRNGKEKIDDCFLAETKDKIKVRIKPFIIAKQKTSNSVITALIKESRRLAETYSKESNFTSLIQDILYSRFQMKIKQSLKIIYPLNIYEIRVIERVK